MKKLFVIVGPTAIGKTALAIEIAQLLTTEIISADSRQFFIETSIGTAKPSVEELNTVPHHFINSHSIQQLFSTGDFEMAALNTIARLFQKNEYLLMVGGSGLYIDAVCKGLDDLPAIDLNIRKQLSEQFKNEGIETLQVQLKKVGLAAYEKMDIHNPQRVIRALEVFYSTGKPLSAFQTNTIKKRDFQIVKIGLNKDRTLLYEGINQRVDLMMASGLLEEVRALMPFKDLNALKTVGYAELFDYLEGFISLEQAIDKIKQNTRRFAKRQLTWFRRDESIHWFDPANQKGIMDFVSSNLGAS